MFPRIPTKTLAGRPLVFPDGIRGQKTFLVLVFEDQGRYEAAQDEGLRWTAFWEQQLSQASAFYEIPMMSGKYGLISFWVDAGMRSGIDPQKHDLVACFYGDKHAYQQQLGITDLSKAHVFLLGESGEILFRASGPPEQAQQAELLRLLGLQP